MKHYVTFRKMGMYVCISYNIYFMYLDLRWMFMRNVGKCAIHGGYVVSDTVYVRKISDYHAGSLHGISNYGSYWDVIIAA